MGGVAVFLLCWLFGLRWSSTGAYRLFGGTNGSLWEHANQWLLPRTAVASVSAPAVSDNQPHPTSIRVPLVLAGKSGPVSSGVTAFFLLSSGVRETLCVPCKNGVSYSFPQLYGSPAIKLCWLSKPSSLGTPPPPVTTLLLLIHFSRVRLCATP